MFRLSTQLNKYKEAQRDTMFPQRPPPFEMNDSVFMDQGVVQNPSHFLWQSLTPELRAEALRRAHLIHLLRQVNPNLQLCRKSYSQPQTSTAEKGVQVPDIRYELVNNRRLSVRPEPKRNASFTAPGVRIQPRAMAQMQPDLNQTQPPPSQPRINILKPNTSLNIQDKPPQKRQPLIPKIDSLQVTVKTTLKKPGKAIPCDHTNDESEAELKEIVEEKESIPKDKAENVDNDAVVVEANDDEKDDSAEKVERQVTVKSKYASSGDEDSVVVVLHQPRSEQGLERKYGQFFCRRCLRGWSSRSVWCVRHTCKVYIKQTCNACNKLVNPYLVCRLPPTANARKERK